MTTDNADRLVKTREADIATQSRQDAMVCLPVRGTDYSVI